MPELNVGDAAPDFAVTAHTGETVKLADYRGKHVVLWFYPKADTPGCTVEGKGFRDRFADLGELDAVVLGVSFDPVEELTAFAEKFEFPYLLLSDTERTIGLAYGAADSKEAQHARRISYLIAPDGTIARAYGEVSPERHPAQVLEDLAAATNG